MGIVLVALTAQILFRIFSWEFEIYEESLVVKRPFGLGGKHLKTLKLKEVERVHFSAGYRMSRKMTIYTKPGKKYMAFYDLNLIEHRELTTLFITNKVELSMSGGSWTF